MVPEDRKNGFQTVKGENGFGRVFDSLEAETRFNKLAQEIPLQSENSEFTTNLIEFPHHNSGSNKINVQLFNLVFDNPKFNETKHKFK